MALILIATPGAIDANSYETVAEAQDYFDTRLSITEWDDADSQEALLIMGTRILDAMNRPLRVLVPAQQGMAAYYRIRRQWTGQPTSSVQALAWPRTGMYDANGFPLDPTIIPIQLKEALSELAGQLAKEDRTLDNDVIVQGVTSVKAGSVAVTFKNSIFPQVIPDAVLNLMPPSWFTDELIEPAWPAEIAFL